MNKTILCTYDCDRCGKVFQDDLYPKHPMTDGILCGDCLRYDLEYGSKAIELLKDIVDSGKIPYCYSDPLIIKANELIADYQQFCKEATDGT